MINNGNPVIGDVTSLLTHMPIPVCVFRGPDHVYEMANSQYMNMVNHRDVLGKSLREAWPEAAGQGFYELFDQIYASGEPYHIPISQASIVRQEGGELEDVWFHLIYQPFHDEQGNVAGILHMALDITEQIKAQQENERLTKNLQMYKTMVDNAPDAIGVSDMDGTITHANPAFKTLFGHGDHTLGMHIPDLVLSSEQEQFGAAFQTVNQEGAWQGELTYQRADESTFPAVVSSFMVIDEQNNPQAVAAIIRDISDRKQMEEDIRQSEERLRFVLEGSSDGAWDTNLVTGEAYFAPRYAEMFGYAPEELEPVTDTWLNAIHPDDFEATHQAFQDYVSGKIPTYYVEHRLRCKSGDYLWVLSRGKITQRDEQNNPIRMTGTVTDITERKQMEENLRLYNTLVENAADGIGVTSLDGTVTYANSAYRKMCGHGEDMIGANVTDFYNDPPERIIELVQLVNEQGSWRGEISYKRKDGTSGPGFLSAFMVKNEQGERLAIAGIIRDISDQKKQEEERLQLQEQVIEAQRAALIELSSPLIPIADKVVIMPLIGSIDTARAQLVMETLLEGVATHNAETAIIDITGMQVVDTQVANALIQAAQAVSLLGAQVVLTGIGPSMAQTLVGLGADLSSIVTRGQLQKGIAYALGSKQ